MNRIDATFKTLRTQKKRALIPYIMAGDPDLGTTEDLIFEIERAGGDILELGIPFSDPIADGPTIQRASERALKTKTTLRKVMTLVKRVRKKGVSIPIILMTYYNIVFRYGIDRFVQDAISSGIDGVIVPDLPPEEAAELLEEARSSGLATIFLLAPTSTEERIKVITSVSTGFLYYVSMTGITGARLRNISEIRGKIAGIREYTDLPICVGFGISKGEEAKRISRWADGVIVGSTLVKLIEVNSGRRLLLPKVSRFIEGMKAALQ